MKNRHVALISTSPAGSCGSMNRYLHLVQKTLSGLPEDKRPMVSVCCLVPDDKLLHKIPASFRVWFTHLWVWFHARRRVLALKPDLCHIMDGSCAYVVHQLAGIPCVVTAHDLIPLLYIKGRVYGKSPSFPARWLVKQSIEGLSKARMIAAVSGYTRTDLEQLVGVSGEKIRVLHNALDPQFTDRAVSSLNKTADSIPVIMHLGNNGDYKNRAGVLRIAARIGQQRKIQINMVGPAPTTDLVSLASELRISDLVSWIRAETDADLITLYEQADLLLFPSLYEGFGWPPLEAMACGCPVVCSNAASLPEVVGDAALTADPEDFDTLTRHCLKLLNDNTQKHSLVKRGRENIKRFTPEVMGRGLYDLYQQSLEMI